MKITYSIIIPVYNRPDEIDELLHSLTFQTLPFEVVIVEDGSPNTCEAIVENYKSKLEISYFLTENQGAGKSRNYGMERARGNYFIIFDSDCLIPSDYLNIVDKQLRNNFTDAYGGPDAAHSSFTPLQKAINYSMTSVLTTGGIRGKKKAVGKFQPRSFNLGISKKAFEATAGFSDLKIGEDIDLTFRLWKAGFETQLIEGAHVYHKRRSTLKQFFKQTYAFGKARPLLNRRYPSTAKLTYWFPSLFVLGLVGAVSGSFFGLQFGLGCYLFYFLLLIAHSLFNTKNVNVAILSVVSTLVQFCGYGLGFLTSVFRNNA